MGEVKGIKETKEALVAIVALGVFVAKRLKDGADLGDAMALGEALLVDNADHFKQKVMDGINGIDQVPEEIKDLSIVEGFELAQELPKLLEILKG